MILDAALFNTQHYKAHIKGKVDQGMEKHPLHLDVVANEKRAFGSPLTSVTNFNYFVIFWYTAYFVISTSIWNRPICHRV